MRRFVDGVGVLVLTVIVVVLAGWLLWEGVGRALVDVLDGGAP